jgi:hypothetical protein
VDRSDIKSLTYSGANICSDDYFHICSAQANFGGISVDWSKNEVTLSVFTPHENEPVAASVTLSI